MQYSRNEVITGAVVLIALALLIALMLALGNFSAWFKKTFPIYVYFNDVGYLSNHTKVLQTGVPVGEVVSIEHLKPGERVTLSDGTSLLPSVRVTLHLEEGTHVSKGSIIYIDTKGLLGEPFVAIGNGPATPMQALEPGGSLKGMDSMSLVRAMSDMSALLGKMNLDALDVGELQHKVSSLLDDATQFIGLASSKVGELDVAQLQSHLVDVVRKAGDLVDSATELVASSTIQRIFANLDGMTGNFNVVSASFARDYTELRGGLVKVVDLSRQVLLDVDQLLTANRENIDGLLANLKGSTEQMNRHLGPLMENARGLLSKLDGLMGDNKGNLDETFLNLRQFTANAEEFSRIIAESPWRLIWKTDKRRSPGDEAPAWVEDALQESATGAADAPLIETTP